MNNASNSVLVNTFILQTLFGATEKKHVYQGNVNDLSACVFALDDFVRTSCMLTSVRWLQTSIGRRKDTLQAKVFFSRNIG